MPKFLNKGFSAHRENKVYNMRRCTSEPSLHTKSDGYLNLLKDYTNLLRDYENQGVIKRIMDYQFNVLKNEFITLKEEIQNVQKVQCQVCFSVVHNNDAIHMGDCGHGACRPCFVNSVVHAAINLRQHNEVDTIEESWRCFSCREFNYSYLQYQRGVFTVKYVSCRTELRDKILRYYRNLEKSLKLPSLSQDFQENELWPVPEENIMLERSVVSEDTQPNEESETCNILRTFGPDETVENESTSERAQIPTDVIATDGLQTLEGLEMVEKAQIHGNATHFDEPALFKEININEVAQIPN